MTEIEEKFFKIFGVDNCSNCDRKKSLECYYCDNKYPEITDRVLLELICILNDFEGISVKATTIEELKEELLKQCIEPFEYPIAFEEHYEIDKLYQQVRALFEGEGEE